MADEGVSADGDGCAGWLFWGCGGLLLLLLLLLLLRGSGGSGGADQVTPDADFGLDDDAAAEDDVLGAVELSATCDFVAGVGLNVVRFGLGGGHGSARARPRGWRWDVIWRVKTPEGAQR